MSMKFSRIMAFEGGVQSAECRVQSAECPGKHGIPPSRDGGVFCLPTCRRRDARLIRVELLKSKSIWIGPDQASAVRAVNSSLTRPWSFCSYTEQEAPATWADILWPLQGDSQLQGTLARAERPVELVAKIMSESIETQNTLEFTKNRY